MTQSERVVIKANGTGVYVIACIIPVLIGWAALRSVQASIELGEFWSIGIVAVVVLAFMIWLLVTLVFSALAPSLILTPKEIIKPRAFRNRVNPVTPDRRIGLFETTRSKTRNRPGEASVNRRVAIAHLMRLDDNSKPAVLMSGEPNSPALSNLLRNLDDVTGPRPEILKQDPTTPTRRADIRHWQTPK